MYILRNQYTKITESDTPFRYDEDMLAWTADGIQFFADGWRSYIAESDSVVESENGAPNVIS
jgi:hypothetical protein